MAFVVFGSLLGEAAGMKGMLGDVLWYWFGTQGWEYLDLGRFWQILLVAGLLIWGAILFRGLRGRLRNESIGNMPYLFLYAALALPVFYAAGLLATRDSSFVVTDFWRFWVVHLWVEDFLDLFTTATVAWMSFANLFPIGLLQLYDSLANGYWHARELAFVLQPVIHFLEWARLPGDVLFIVGGVLPLLYLAFKAVLRPRPACVGEECETLFTEIETRPTAS